MLYYDSPPEAFQKKGEYHQTRAMGYYLLADMAAHDFDADYCFERYPGPASWAWQNELTEWKLGHGSPLGWIPDRGIGAKPGPVEAERIWRHSVRLMINWPIDVAREHERYPDSLKNTR